MLDGESVHPDHVVASANMLPAMAERRLVIVRKADRMNAAQLGVIAEYAADPNPSTTLVLTGAKFPKNTKVYKAIEKLGGAAEYKAPKKHEYPRAVVGMFSVRGKTIGLEAAEVLVRAVGFDLRRLDIEIDKVVAFTGDRDTLTRADLEEVMSTTAPTSVFDLLDELGQRHAGKALRLLAEILSGGESIYGIHAMAVRHIRQLLSVRAVLDRPNASGSPASIASAVGIQDWQARNLIRQAERFSARELVHALRSAAAGEAEMKTSRDSRLVFERWLVEVCDSSPRAAAASRPRSPAS